MPVDSQDITKTCSIHYYIKYNNIVVSDGNL